MSKKKIRPKIDFALEGASPDEEFKKTELYSDRPFTIHIIPQSHIDLAWMWTRQEAEMMALETFRGHVQVLEKDPSRTYAQSQLAAYKIVEEQDPGLFLRIRELVRKGQWEIVGGEWVEPDNAIPSGESRLRQLLTGQRYAKKKFGHTAKIAWCPDSFIYYPANMPQIWLKSGLSSLVLKRPREKFIHLPLVPFLWESPDGSRIICHRSNNKGFGFPLLSEGTGINKEHNDLTVYAYEYRNAGLRDLWAPLGTGDVGGVNKYLPPPSGKGWKAEYSLPSRFFQAVSRATKNKGLPVISGGIGPIMTGALTSHAEMKWFNRLAEMELLRAEFLEALAGLLLERRKAADLNVAWEKVLFNQFHDVVTGVGTAEVHREAAHDYQEACKIAQKISICSARAIAQSIILNRQKEGLRIVVFNNLGWQRDDVVKAWVDLDGKIENRWIAVDSRGGKAPVSLHQVREHQGKWRRYLISFVAEDVPAMGYQTFSLRCEKSKQLKLSRQGLRISNEYFKVGFNAGNGRITSLAPIEQDKNISGGLCEWRIYEEGKYFLDYGEEMRAWYLGLTGKVEPVKFEHIKILVDNPSRVVIQTLHSYGRSRFIQNFTFRPGFPRIDVDVEMDWHEKEKIARLIFPLKTKDKIEFFRDEPYGFCHLPADGVERPMQYLCAAKDKNCGIAILNFGRYGCSAYEKELRISAIRCSTYPDERSDHGEYSFRYAILPLNKNCTIPQIVKQGYEFNHPLYGIAAERDINGKLPKKIGLLSHGSKKLLPVLLKRSEKKGCWTLRLFNASNQQTQSNIIFKGHIQKTKLIDIPELTSGEVIGGKKCRITANPREIITLCLNSWKVT